MDEKKNNSWIKAKFQYAFTKINYATYKTDL